MILFALDPWWNDFYAAGGFWIGLVGGIVGIAGLWYAILQVWKVEAAATAAKQAAEETLAKSKNAYGKFVGSFARRLLSSLESAVSEKDWKLAVLRANDLAELIASVSEAIPDAADLAYQLRVFGQKFAAGTPKTEPKYRNEKWNALVLELHARLDNVNAPFRNNSHGQADPAFGRTETARDRTDPPPKDEGGAGKLDSGDPDPK
ncbi:MAG: hypothetical protein J0I06_14975 [Planctomycetes bacterium]|nr:hypothetical protein [Planctomycetota bacterium]